MIKVLFVCLGNICRSPLAEAIFDAKIQQRGFGDKVSSDSAGTANYHIGEDPDHRTIATATAHNIPISHKGRQFKHQDGKEFQYILTMDAQNKRDVIHELDYHHEGLFLMRDFDEEAQGANVPDPYYGDKEEFEEVFDILNRSTTSFLNYLIAQNQLE